MKIKTNELTGAALDWAVAKCEGVISDDIDDFCLSTPGEYAYSTDWSQGGPIIEREGISLDFAQAEDWAAKSSAYQWAYGPTPLVAAMRCYVAKKMGDTIEVPDELV